jgi:hypothetical protein
MSLRDVLESPSAASELTEAQSRSCSTRGMIIEKFDRWRARRRRAAGPSRLRPRLVGELLVVLVLVKVYDFVRSLAATRQDEALEHGRAILALESKLQLDVERTINLWLSSSRLLTETASGWYQFMHLPTTLLALACCYWRRPDIYRRARNSLVLINIVGLTVFWLYPVAPPRLLPGAGFIDVGVLAGYAAGPAGPVSPDMYAALPSLHLAWATWTVIVARRLLPDHPWGRRLIPAYAAITSAVVVATANHYVLDVAAGVAVCLIAANATSLITVPQIRVPGLTRLGSWTPGRYRRRSPERDYLDPPGEQQPSQV